MGQGKLLPSAILPPVFSQFMASEAAACSTNERASRMVAMPPDQATEHAASDCAGHSARRLVET
jgi:hypothetical protein